MGALLSKKVAIGLCVAVVALTSVFLLWHLGTEPLQDYDEATYAQVVHEARADGNFISFTYGGVSYQNKPPLMFWAMAASESVFGETPFAMRLPFALTGIALVAAIILLGAEISGSYLVGAFAGAIALTTGPLMETARQVRMDVPVTFFIVAAVYGFARALKNPRWFLLFGLFAGLAVLCKDVIASFAFLAAFFIMLFLWRVDVLKNKQFWYGIGVFLAVTLPWHIAETVQFGWAFWEHYIGMQVIERTQQNLFWTVTITNGDLWNYVKEFFEPWLAVGSLALVYFGFNHTSLPFKNRRYILAFLATLCCMLVVFLVSVTKAPTYLMPLYPFVALSIALIFGPLVSSRYKQLFWCAAVGLLLWGGVITVYNAYHYNPYYSITLQMAVDEKAIGDILAGTPVGTQWYVYNDPNLGSIMFYSQRLGNVALAQGDVVAAGSFIVVDSDSVPQLAMLFPKLKTTSLYNGPQVTLLQTN